jgi:arsenite/tail-anchored protein-transporting ATPase
MRILLFTGKGGVGKTTTAAATAVRLADEGRKTLLVSTDAAHSVSDTLGVDVPAQPTEIVSGLWAAQPDPQRQLDAAWRQIQRYAAGLLDRAGLDQVAADELTVLPGIEEVLALLAVRDLAVRGDWDVLVVDCAPTAETLRLLALPEALGWYLDKVFPAQRRLARGLRPLASLLGRGDLLPPDTVFAALVALCDELASVRELLADQRTTSVRLVVTPEAVVVAEARRTFTALCLYGYQVDQVIANRVFPAGTESAASAWLQGWVRAQADQLATITDSFAGVSIQRVPYAEGEPVGLDALRAVADSIYGLPPGIDPAPPGEPVEQLRVERAGDEFDLIVSLPLAEPGEVDAARAGDELIVTVGRRRRVVSLPSGLRRCEVVGGRYADGYLRIRFRPDPALWPAAETT